MLDGETMAMVRRIEWAAAVWIVVLIIVSLQPYRPSVETSPAESSVLLHRLIHIVDFAIPALALCATRRTVGGLWKTALLMICLGIWIETAQLVINRNVFEWWDVRDDTIGVLLAFILSRPLRKSLPTLEIRTGSD